MTRPGWLPRRRTHERERRVTAEKALVRIEDQPACGIRQYSDQMVCSVCHLQWDTNDPDPPICPRTKKPAA